jgi:2',3'-cyclic-nucleotide 2'-phosphodiesterase (5'-nucleotidase family)
MTQAQLAQRLMLAFFAATLVATFAQCEQEDSDDGSSQPAESQHAQDPKQGPGAGAAVAPPPDAIRILISGSMLGHLEPCGCASGQLGGLARRFQHIGEQRNYDLLLEGGDLVAGNTPLDKLKLFTTSQVLFMMQSAYDAVGVGLRDLSLPLDEWSGYLLGGPAVATNLTSTNELWPAKTHLDKSVRKYNVRIASLLAPELPESMRGEDAQITRTDPAAAWRQVFAGQDPAMIRIAMVHGQDTQIRDIIPQLEPKPDLVVGVDTAYIEPDSAAKMVGGVPLVYAGVRGRVLLDARLWREDGEPRVACEPVPLTGSKTVPGGGGDPDVKGVVLMHRMNVAEEKVLEQMAEQSPTPNGAVYVGNAQCAGCHPEATKTWQNSKHAHAWETLVQAEADPKRYGWPVTKYPDCVGCHTVGYGQETGFKTFEDTPHLADVGCERCHGPGSKHMAAPAENKLGIIGGVLKSELCAQCHDFEQSPDFSYSERWQKIAHDNK